LVLDLGKIKKREWKEKGGVDLGRREALLKTERHLLKR
jgi:hypothetical protein